MSEMFDSQKTSETASDSPGTADKVVAQERLVDIQNRFIERWGELASVWGTQRSGGRLHSLLYVAPEPLHAEAIGERLQISHGNTSTTVRQLLSAGVIRRLHRPGERRAYYTSEPDPWQWMRNTIALRREREVAPVIASMAELLEETEALEGEVNGEFAADLRATRDKIRVFLTFLEQMQALLDAFLADPQGHPVAPAPREG